MINRELLLKLNELCDGNIVFFTAAGKAELSIAEVDNTKQTIRFRRSTGKIVEPCKIEYIKKICTQVNECGMEANYKNANKVVPYFGNYIVGLLNYIGYDW